MHARLRRVRSVSLALVVAIPTWAYFQWWMGWTNVSLALFLGVLRCVIVLKMCCLSAALYLLYIIKKIL